MLDAFHLFPRLPIELRLLIWEHALPKSRLIDLCNRKVKGTRKASDEKIYCNRHNKYFEGVTIDYLSQYYIPIEEVNREARQVVMKSYKWYPRTNAQYGCKYPAYFFNGARDILYSMGDQWISEHSLAEPPDSIFSIANWFKYIEHKDVKQLCISRSVLLGMHFEEQCCVGEMFENNSTLISFDGQITCFPNLEKLWLWEGDATWPEGWEPEYERDAEKIEDFLNREDQDITPPEGLTEDDLTLIWHHKESTEPCVQCGSQGHRSACGPSPLTVNFWRGYPYEDLETGKPNFS